MKKKNLISEFYQKRAYLFIALFLLFIIFVFGAFLIKNNDKEFAPPVNNIKNSNPEVIKKVEPKIEIKESDLLSVPFTVQAPFANWTVHEESCEEAAILMYHHYLLGDNSLNLNQTEVDKNIRAMKTWQKVNYGVEPDLTIEKLGKFANEYYKYKYFVINNGTKEDIKKLISEGSPVLVPVMTHSLKNPHYGRDNTYHILLIKGYDSFGVTTNDAGIKDGKDYYYTWEILFSAIDAQAEIMSQGRELLTLSKD